MILKRDWVADLIRTGEAWDCRPVFRRNGQPMGYKLDGVYPVQPGRFQPHVVHVRIIDMEPTTPGTLRLLEEEGWQLPDDWPDDMPVQVMLLRVEPRRDCCAPIAGLLS